MDYEPLELKAEKYDLNLAKPEGSTDTAIIEGPANSLEMNILRPIAQELIDSGVNKLVLDLSAIPEERKRGALIYLHGFFTAFGFDMRYIGITPEVMKSEDVSLGDDMPQIAEDLDSAVESYNQ